MGTISCFVGQNEWNSLVYFQRPAHC